MIKKIINSLVSFLKEQKKKDNQVSSTSKKSLNYKDESWKYEAINALEERIAAFNKLSYLGLNQQARFN